MGKLGDIIIFGTLLLSGILVVGFIILLIVMLFMLIF